MTAREVLLAWAKSEGFAAIHNGGATDEQIVHDLVRWLMDHGMIIVAAEPLAKLFLPDWADKAT